MDVTSPLEFQLTIEISFLLALSHLSLYILGFPQTCIGMMDNCTTSINSKGLLIIKDTNKVSSLEHQVVNSSVSILVIYTYNKILPLMSCPAEDPFIS